MDMYNVSVERTAVKGITNMCITASDEENAKYQVSCFKDGGKNLVPISVERMVS
jgi:hypothetical protein